MAVEIESAGIPTAQIYTMTPVALMVGSNRIVPSSGIVHPLGNPESDPVSAMALRRSILGNALEALQTKLKVPQLFSPLP
jgi:glycine reductase